MSTDETQKPSPQPTPSKTPLLFATCIALIAVGLGAFNFTQATTSHQQSNALQNQLSQLEITQTQQLNQLQKKVTTLDHHANTQTQQSLAQISYLIQVANINLALKHNPQKALSALKLAQNLLSNQQNTALLSFKNALTTDIAALEAVPVVPVNQLASQILSIQQSIIHLSALPEKPTTQNAVAPITPDHLRWYQRAWHEIKKVKSLFVIRHLKETPAPILIPAAEATVKQNIVAQLTMAEWALLHHNNTVYQSSLQTASQWLSHYFSMQSDTGVILKQLSDLQKTSVDPTLPTLDNTLTALSEVKLPDAAEQPLPPTPVTATPAQTPTSPTPATPKSDTPTPSNTTPPKAEASAVET